MSLPLSGRWVAGKIEARIQGAVADAGDADVTVAPAGLGGV